MPLFSCYPRAGLNASFPVAFSFRWVDRNSVHRRPAIRARNLPVSSNALWRSRTAGSLPAVTNSFATISSSSFSLTAPHFFSFSPTRRRIRFVRDALKSFSMEASVCLACDVSRNWSGLAPWQWYRRCSRSGRALGALCPVRASKAVVASLSFALHHLLDGIDR
jgi:hypothetical protein